MQLQTPRYCKPSSFSVAAVIATVIEICIDTLFGVEKAVTKRNALNRKLIPQIIHLSDNMNTIAQVCDM